MTLFAAYRTMSSYSVVAAESADAVWDEAERQGVQLLAVVELKRKSSKTFRAKKVDL